jgi:hypothetical protein
MIWVKLAAEAASWAVWFWRNRTEFAPVIDGVGGVDVFTQNVFANPNGAVRRIGNTLVFGDAEGGPKVLAFIEQTAPKIEHIEQAIKGIQAEQLAISASLTSLQTISMVTLGVSALTPVILGAQFIALNKQLGAIHELLVRLHKKHDASERANLKAGLDFLQQGQDFLEKGPQTHAQLRLNDALGRCQDAMKYYGELLGNELNEKKVNRIETRLLARHLAVAVTSVASCQIHLEQDQFAFAQSATEMKLLRDALRWVFHETVGRDPGPYLISPMRAQGVSIDFMANVYQQARDAGALEPCEDGSASAWFAQHGDSIVRARQPWFRVKAQCDRLKVQLMEVVAAIEETNRVLGLSRLVQEAQMNNKKTRELILDARQHANHQGDDRSPFIVWGLD